MFRRGTRSWRFSHDIGQTPHALLFVRDALGLAAGDGPGEPPRLSGDVPDLTARLDDDSRREAGGQWPAWWRGVLLQEAAAMSLDGRWMGQPDPSPEARAQRGRAALGRMSELIDPPEWGSLRGRPALRAAAQACYTDGCRWADVHRQPLLRRGENAPIFEWHVVRDAAEAAASEHGVDPGEIDGRAVVLAVVGHWHALLAPGVAVCSVSDASDPQAATVVLREVFASWIAR